MSSGEILPPWASTGKCTFSMYQSCFMLTVPSPTVSRTGAWAQEWPLCRTNMGTLVHDFGRPMASSPGHNIEVLVTPQVQSISPP